MAINLYTQNNYSFLFSSLNNNTSGAANLNFLSDYAAIKNGSYGKLMKAYYSEGSEAVKSIAKSKSSVSSEDKTALAKVQTDADALKESADKLLVSGKDSVFNKKEVTKKDANGAEVTTQEYDVESIYKAVKGFVDDYNSLVNAVDESGNERVVDRATTMAGATIANAKMLNAIGISINEDSTLTLDKEKFESANMSTVKTLFNGNGSYGYRVSAQASIIDYTAENQASRNSTYNISGTMNNTYSSGNLFSTFF